MKRSEALTIFRRKHFPTFFKMVSRDVHPGKKLCDGWHLQHMALQLAGCLPGANRLIINGPPRSGKSFITSIAFAVFALGQDPTRKIMIVTGNRKLANELEQDIRALMCSPSVLTLFPHLRFDQRLKYIRTAAGGQVTFSVFGRSIVGRGADIIIVDDPMSPTDVVDQTVRAEKIRWFNSDLLPRLNHPATGLVIVVMQRLHKDDLTGMLLRAHEPWKHICFAAIAPSDEVWSLPDGSVYNRWKREPLQPEVANHGDLLRILEQIGPAQFSLQYQQDATVIEFRNDSFRMPDVDSMAGRDRPYRRNPRLDRMRYELFGLGEPWPVNQGVREITPEEWEREAMEHQARLVAEVQADALRREQESHA